MSSTRRNWASILIVAAMLLLVVALLSISYSAGVAALLGIAIGVLLRATRVRRGLSCLFISLILFVVIGYAILNLGAGIGAPSSLIKEYRASIEVLDTTTFRIREEAITYGDELVQFPERQVSAVDQGLLLKEVSFAPLQPSASGAVDIPLADGTSLHGKLCAVECPASHVEIIDFPKNAFYAAKDSEALTTFPYIDTESLSWSMRSLERGITFAYVPAPFNIFRPLLQPLVGLTNLSQWIVGLVGLIITMVITPMVKPLLTDKLKDKLKARLNQKPEQALAPKVKIIVSSKGDEKEVDTRK